MTNQEITAACDTARAVARDTGWRLVYLKACAAWTFTDRLPGEAAFYELRDAAVDAAHRHGLTVSSDGTVS